MTRSLPRWAFPNTRSAPPSCRAWRTKSGRPTAAPCCSRSSAARWSATAEASRDAARVVIALFSPAAEQARLAEDRGTARYQLTRVAFALAIYRAENGEYPERLEQLVPAALAELPSDPFTGRPFVYQRTDDGFRLYSVGDNQQDDGGATFDTDPRGDDLPVIVPLPAAE